MELPIGDDLPYFIAFMGLVGVMVGSLLSYAAVVTARHRPPRRPGPAYVHRPDTALPVATTHQHLVGLTHPTAAPLSSTGATPVEVEEASTVQVQALGHQPVPTHEPASSLHHADSDAVIRLRAEQAKTALLQVERERLERREQELLQTLEQHRSDAQSQRHHDDRLEELEQERQAMLQALQTSKDKLGKQATELTELSTLAESLDRSLRDAEQERDEAKAHLEQLSARLRRQATSPAQQPVAAASGSSRSGGSISAPDPREETLRKALERAHTQTKSAESTARDLRLKLDAEHQARRQAELRAETAAKRANASQFELTAARDAAMKRADRLAGQVRQARSAEAEARKAMQDAALAQQDHVQELRRTLQDSRTRAEALARRDAAARARVRTLEAELARARAPDRPVPARRQVRKLWDEA